MLTPIPTPLCAWLTLLAQAVPNRSALTFLELLLGAMITDRGFVTEALLAITPRRKWPTYFNPHSPDQAGILSALATIMV